MVLKKFLSGIKDKIKMEKNDTSKFLLSIIIPCFNVEKSNKLEKLIHTLSKIKENDVEIIFVDDGSKDNTLNLLNETKKRLNISVTVLTQKNKGPGGARNTGLFASRGEYIWFVDADDDINLSAISFLRKNFHKGYDFIDYEAENNRNLPIALPCEEGEYEGKIAKHIAFNHIGIALNKHIKKEFLIKNKLFYPEYCIYEDSAMYVLYPIYIEKFYKSKILAYKQYDFPDSASRYRDFKYYDRLWTNKWSFEKAWKLLENEEDKNVVLKKFTRLFLINSIHPNKIPDKSWILSARIMKFYRQILNQFDIKTNPLNYWNFSKLFKMRFYLIWFFSRFLSDQTKFFEEIRIKAWNRPFLPPEITIKEGYNEKINN